jgi:hypothetical protein
MQLFATISLLRQPPLTSFYLRVWEYGSKVNKYLYGPTNRQNCPTYDTHYLQHAGAFSPLCKYLAANQDTQTYWKWQIIHGTVLDGSMLAPQSQKPAYTIGNPTPGTYAQSMDVMIWQILPRRANCRTNCQAKLNTSMLASIGSI